jgi:hypothetical protein
MVCGVGKFFWNVLGRKTFLQQKTYDKSGKGFCHEEGVRVGSSARRGDYWVLQQAVLFGHWTDVGEDRARVSVGGC